MNIGRPGRVVVVAQAACLSAMVAACNGTPVVRPAVRLFGDQAVVTGDGGSGCTHQVPASGNGDRWCAIAKPSRNAPALTELWVLNVTRAAAGAVPPCDGTSPACLRMTPNLWTAFPTGGPGHPYSHAFDGDTLIFYANAKTNSTELHRGPVYAWRPGWAQPWQISSADGLLCYGHARAAVAYCMDDLHGDPMHPDDFELRAGTLEDSAAGRGPLPSLGRVRIFRSDGAVAWQAGFSPAGDRFAVSSPDPDPAVETLRELPVGELGHAPPREIVRDLTSWQIAHDGKVIYFMRGEGSSPGGRPLQALYTASYPAGASITRLAPAVRDYIPAGQDANEMGVGFLAQGDAEQVHFRLLRDTTMPDQAATLFSTTDDLEGVRISPDGRTTAWRDSLLVARMVRHQDLASCVLNTTDQHHATMPQYLADSSLLFWTQEAGENDSRQDGFTATPDCQGKREFARGVDLIIPVGDRAVVYTDAYEDRYFTGTLQVAEITGSGVDRHVGRSRRVQDGVAQVVVVGTDPLLLLFRKKPVGQAKPTGDPARAGDPAAEDETGTYLFGPVSF
jgi:hypothetical protein